MYMTNLSGGIEIVIVTKFDLKLQMSCDLMEMARMFLPDFHMHGEVERICRLKTPAGTGADEDDNEHLKKRGDDLNKYLAADSKNKRPFGK